MTDTPRPVNIVNVATGLCFVVLGALLLLHRADVIAMQQIIELWPLALIILGGAVVWQATRGGDTKLGASACAGWLVWVAVLGLLFSYAFDRRAEADLPETDGQLNVFAVMGGDRRSAGDAVFRGGRVTAVMGGTQLDLRSATLAPGETAVLDVFNVFGGTELLVPAGWSLEILATAVAGGINDQRPPSEPAKDRAEAAAIDDDEAGDTSMELDAQAGSPASTAPEPPRLVIQGVVVFGGITVK